MWAQSRIVCSLPWHWNNSIGDIMPFAFEIAWFISNKLLLDTCCNISGTVLLQGRQVVTSILMDVWHFDLLDLAPNWSTARDAVLQSDKLWAIPMCPLLVVVSTNAISSFDLWQSSLFYSQGSASYPALCHARGLFPSVSVHFPSCSSLNSFYLSLKSASLISTGRIVSSLGRT